MERSKKETKLKVKLHFNRNNMRAGDSHVWTAHTSKQCIPSEKIVIYHDGKIIAETIYNPTSQQPRAYFVCKGIVGNNNGVTEIHV